MFAVSVLSRTGPMTVMPAMLGWLPDEGRMSLSSGPVTSHIKLQTQQRTRTVSSPSSKHKDSNLLSSPHVKHGYVWSDHFDNISPSALFTESAPPLPSPPQQVLNDPAV